MTYGRSTENSTVDKNATRTHLQVSRWELLTTGYLDPNGYKRGKGQGTSKIEF